MITDRIIDGILRTITAVIGSVVGGVVGGITGILIGMKIGSQDSLSLEKTTMKLNRLSKIIKEDTKAQNSTDKESEMTSTGSSINHDD